MPRLPERLTHELRVRSALGGLLAEDDDPPAPPGDVGSRFTPRARHAEEWRDLRFAWDVVRHVKSNGVVVVRDGSRAASARAKRTASAPCRSRPIAQATSRAGAALASDGFFPFPDGLESAADAGCTAVIAPRGSIRDDQVIAAADCRGIALVFSNYRYFLH